MIKWLADLGAKIVAQPLEYLKIVGLCLAAVLAISIVIKLIVWSIKR